MRRPTVKSGGFTLLEVLVALAVSGLLAVAIFGGLRYGSRAWATARQRSEVAADAGAVRNLLRETIAQAYPAFAYASYGDRRIAFAGASDSLTFIAPLPASVGEGVHGWIRLSVAEDRLTLGWRLDLPSAEPNVPLPERTVALIPARSVRFAYFGATAPREEPRWRDAWIDQDRLPDLIRVRVQTDDSRTPAWPDLTIEPRTTTNTSCVYDSTSTLCRRVQ